MFCWLASAQLVPVCSRATHSVSKRRRGRVRLQYFYVVAGIERQAHANVVVNILADKLVEQIPSDVLAFVHSDDLASLLGLHNPTAQGLTWIIRSLKSML